MQKFTALVCVVASVLVLATVRHADASFFDGTFNPNDWQMSIYQVGNVGSIGFDQWSGGNPGPCWSTMVVLADPDPVLGSHVQIATINPDWNYSLRDQGAIVSVQYSLDRAGGGAGTGIALLQSGVTYYGHGSVYSASDQWESQRATGLRATDFVDTSGLLHPDFSTGGENLYWGFWIGNSATYPYSGYSSTTNIDNLSIMFDTSVPEPSALLALMSGIGYLSGMAWRKRM